MIEDRQRGLNGIGAALMHHSKHERMRLTEDINVRCSTGDMQELVTYATSRHKCCRLCPEEWNGTAKEVRPLVKAGRIEWFRL
jgi:hypothetical protein